MAWIIAAAVVNTLWTLWCVRLLPARVATHFGLGGQVDGWMSRKGFALFGILFPLGLAAFLVALGGQTGSSGPGREGMEHLAAGLVLFFSCISWTLVRSNRRTPPQCDYPSLFLGLAVLLVFLLLFFSELSRQSIPREPVPQTGSGPVK